MVKVDVQICSCCGQTIHNVPQPVLSKHLETIDRLYGMSLAELRERIRTPIYTEPRQHLSFLLVIESNWPITKVGLKLDRDHRSIAASVFTFAEKMLGYPRFKKLNDLRRHHWSTLGYSKEEVEKRLPPRRN